MQTKDHYLLGCFLLEHQKIFLDPVRRNLFLFGCIEPDINPTTYVRGSIKHQLFHGHNAENIGKHESWLKAVLSHLCNGFASAPYCIIWLTALHLHT